MDSEGGGDENIEKRSLKKVVEAKMKARPGKKINIKMIVMAVKGHWQLEKRNECVKF